MVSGLIAYLRALPSPFAGDAVKMMKYLSRKVRVIDNAGSIDVKLKEEGTRRHIIWNGNVKDENCLIGYGKEFKSDEAKAVCGAVNNGLPDPGNTDNWDPNYEVTDDLLNGGSSNRGAITW